MKRWLDSWSVNEDEPSWAQVVVTGLLFVACMGAMYACVLVIWAVMGV